MKSIYLLAAFTLLSIASVAQNKENDHDKDKHEKTHGDNDHVLRHEKIIWAGTGVDLNNKSKDVKNVPDAVLASFRQFFPNQEIDNVRKYRGLYAITFSNEVYTTTLIYKADGTFVEARTVATDSVLPPIVKEKVRKSNRQYSPDDIVMIEKANKEKLYRLHLKGNRNDQFAVYDEQGNEVHYDY